MCLDYDSVPQLRGSGDGAATIPHNSVSTRHGVFGYSQSIHNLRRLSRYTCIIDMACQNKIAPSASIMNGIGSYLRIAQNMKPFDCRNRSWKLE